MSTAKQEGSGDFRYPRWEIGVLLFAFLASFSCVFSSAVLALTLQSKDSLPTTIEAQNRANYADDSDTWLFERLKADIIDEAAEDKYILQITPEPVQSDSAFNNPGSAIVLIPTSILPTVVKGVPTAVATTVPQENVPPTPTPIPTITSTHTPTATDTATPYPTWTITPYPTWTATPYPTWTATVMIVTTATFTPVPPTPAPTAVPTTIPTVVPSATPTNPLSTPPSMPLPTHTPTATTAATDTPTATATATDIPTSTSTPTATATPDLPQPIAYWTFDEGSGTIANDSMGTYTGVITGATWVAGYDGGSALQFDGLDDYVDLSGADIGGEWTAVMWVRREGEKDGSVLFSSATYGLQLEQWPGTHRGGIIEYGVSENHFNYIAPLGQWVHLAFVRTAAETQLYVNGALYDTTSASINMPMQRIGCTLNLPPDNCLTGTLDEAIVYGQALSPAQVAAIYNSYPPP